jgi:hypothetical protein
MKQLLCVIAMATLVLSFPIYSYAQIDTIDVYATQGYLNDLIDGTEAGAVYRLVSLDTTYKYTDAVVISADITIVGSVDPATGRPPTIQPAVLPDASIPETMFSISGSSINVHFKNLYLLAKATNNVANADGIAVVVTGDEVRLTVDECIFDGWQAFAIGYNGQWDSFFINNSYFRNMVHPNQWYIGEVLRNMWPGEAYTDTVSMIGNTMIAVNAYASAPVTLYYMDYFEFIDNKVIYMFKNPFFIFNATNAKLNNNIFHAAYVGGVDQTEHPWWDNLAEPDDSYGLIAFHPLLDQVAEVFNPDDPGAAEGLRRIEVKDNVYYWPSAITEFWSAWNDTASNWIYTPNWMSERTVSMFADNDAFPYLEESGNIEQDPGFNPIIDESMLYGTGGNDIGILAYFQQIRTGTAATDVWGFGITQVEDAPDWIPSWPLPETGYITSVDEVPADVPERYVLEQNYPNPFNPSTTIRYTIPQSGKVVLSVFNVLGQEVRTLVNEVQNAGIHEVTVDGSRLSSGMYFYKLTAGDFTDVKKMLLVK